MRRLLAVIVVGAVVSHGAREARAQAVMGGPYSGSYRVSDYFAAPGLYGTSYGFASYGVPRTFTTFSAYPGPSYGSNVPGYGFLPGRYGVGLWRPGFTAWLRLRSAHLWELVPHLPCRLRHHSDRRPDCPAAVDRRLCTSSGTEHRPLRPLITRLRLTRREPGLVVWSGDQRPALDDSSEPAPPGGKS